MWEDPEGAGDMEPLNSDESLSVEEVSPPPTPSGTSLSRPFHLGLRGFTLHCLRRLLGPFPEAAAKQDNAEYPQDPPLHPSSPLDL